MCLCYFARYRVLILLAVCMNITTTQPADDGGIIVALEDKKALTHLFPN